MKWNRRGILICAIGFLALAVVLAGRGYFSQFPQKNDSTTYASEEDVVTPSAVSGTELAAEDEKAGKKQTKMVTATSTATPTAIPTAVQTAVPSSGKQAKTEEKKKTKAVKGKKKATDKNTERPTARPVSPLARTTEPTVSPGAATVSFAIQCTSIINHRELWRDGLEEVIPTSGYFYQGHQEISAGDTVYDLLKRICDKNNIALDAEYTPLFGSYYIKGIGNLYEFDCGSESGWKYMVNDTYADVSSSSYILKKGDRVVFTYDFQL